VDGVSSWLHFMEIKLYDASGAQLPSSSLTLFMSTYNEDSEFPGGAVCCRCVPQQSCSPGISMCPTDAAQCPHPGTPPELCIDGDLSTFCSTTYDNGEGYFEQSRIDVAYPCEGGSTTLSKVGADVALLAAPRLPPPGPLAQCP
jgi:hypothetical protein